MLASRWSLFRLSWLSLNHVGCIVTAMYCRFYELLEGVAQICERECGLLPANVSPDCAIQLTYVASVLRSPECYNVKHVVSPKLTHFNQGKI